MHSNSSLQWTTLQSSTTARTTYKSSTIVEVGIEAGGIGATVTATDGMGIAAEVTGVAQGRHEIGIGNAAEATDQDLEVEIGQVEVGDVQDHGNGKSGKKDGNEKRKDYLQSKKVIYQVGLFLFIRASR